MKTTNSFPFKRSRRITIKELQQAKHAIERITGRKRKERLGRPPKMSDEKYVAISIRLAPTVVQRAKSEAKKKHVGYQTLINEILTAQLCG